MCGSHSARREPFKPKEEGGGTGYQSLLAIKPESDERAQTQRLLAMHGRLRDGSERPYVPCPGLALILRILSNARSVSVSLYDL